MTTIYVTFDCQRCGAGHELNLGTGAITLRDQDGRAGASVDPPEADAVDAAATVPALQPSPATAAEDDASPVASDDASPASPSAAAPDDGSCSSSDASPGSQRRKEAKLQARTSRARDDAEQRRAERTEAFLAYLDQHGEATIREIAEGLGVKVAQLTPLRRELEVRGRISWRRAKPGTEQIMYYRVPLGREAENVEITQDDTDVDALRRVIARRLQRRGAATVPELAQALDCHAAVIAQACSEMARDGEIARQPGGRFLPAGR